MWDKVTILLLFDRVGAITNIGKGDRCVQVTKIPKGTGKMVMGCYVIRGD